MKNTPRTASLQSQSRNLCAALTYAKRHGWNVFLIDEIEAERLALHQRLDAGAWPWEPQLSARLDAVDYALEQIRGSEGEYNE